jgi:hypothetical protein
LETQHILHQKEVPKFFLAGKEVKLKKGWGVPAENGGGEVISMGYGHSKRKGHQQRV